MNTHLSNTHNLELLLFSDIRFWLSSIMIPFFLFLRFF